MSEVATATNWDSLPLLLTTADMMALYRVTDRKTISAWTTSGHVPRPVFTAGRNLWDREQVRQHLERRQRM